MFDVNVDLTRLEESIVKFEQKEIQTGKIMFYGNSGFTRWKTEKWGHRPLEEDIRMKDGSSAAINHGFGTSTTEEQLYYYRRAVLPWKPRALVLLSYANNSTQGYSPSEMISLLARLCDYARHDIPGIKFYLCNVRPLLSYVGNPAAILRAEEYNFLLEAYCKKHDDCIYVDHTKFPLFYNTPEDAGGYENLREELFVEDKVHYNQKGYDVYKKFFLEILDEIL